MIVPKGIRDELRWFYEARFGMFVHFGLYSLLGRGEWAMYHEAIPRDTYSRLIDDFNPYLFDARAWVQLARDAGARYITVTAKHHDGFCLFDSALTDFKITHTPFKRDLIGELIRACQDSGMPIILYYSQPDWHHANYVHWSGAFKDLAHPPQTDQPDWPAYQRYYIGQVEELCRNYGPIDGIWFDGSHKSVEAWRGKEVYELIKRCQPHAVVNDRARYGDFFTPERSLPEDLTGYLFEACESVSPVAWGYQNDSPLYTTPHLVRSLVKMASAGGNYLLNVGPQPDGRIPDRQAQVMREIGTWLRVNGRAVYQTEPVRLMAPQVRRRMAIPPATEPFSALAGRTGTTRDDSNIYYFCLEWPERDRFIIPGIQSMVREVRLLGNDQAIQFEQSELGVELFDLPATPPDALVQVFALVCDQAPDVMEAESSEAEPAVIELKTTGSTILPASLAIREGRAVKGSRLSVEQDAEHQTTVLSGWMVPEQEARWTLACPEDGMWQVSIYGRCPVDAEQAVVQITVQGQTLSAALPGPQAAQNIDPAYPRVIAGTLHLAAGRAMLTLRPEHLVWGYVLGKVEKLQLDRV